MSGEAEAIMDTTLENMEARAATMTWAEDVFPLRGYISPEGVILGEHSGLVLLTKMDPLSLDGLPQALAESQARAFEKQLNKLPESFAFQFWVDRAVVGPEMPEIGEDADPMAQELQRSRYLQLAEEQNYHNSFYLAIEHHGNFAFGGPELNLLEGWTAGVKSLVTRDRQKRKELVMQWKSVLPGSEFAVQNALQFAMEDDAELMMREVRRFCGAVFEAVKPEVFSQEGETDTEPGLRIRILDPREGFCALDGIGEHRARGRQFAKRLSEESENLADLKYLADLPAYLARSKPDFAVAFGRRGEDGRIHRVGQFCTGGQPKKAYEIRCLPPEVMAEFFRFICSFPCPLTYRVRWEPYSTKESRDRLKKHKSGIGIADSSKNDIEVAGAKDVKAEFVDMARAIANGSRFGRLSILIQLVGVEGKDSLGRPLSAGENLEKACSLLEERLQKMDVEFSEELLHQGIAYLAMFPGCVNKARLAHMDTTSDVFTNLITLHDHHVPQPEIKEFEHKTPWLLTVDRSGHRTNRSLVTGKVLTAFVMGGMGKGKSFWLSQNFSGFYLTHENAGVDLIERGGSGAATARSMGGAAIPMGNPAIQGKLNPFDVPVDPVDGYDAVTKADLLSTVQACIGREDFEAAEMEAMRRALVELGTAPLLMEDVGINRPPVRSLNLFAKRLGYVSEVGRRLAMQLIEFRSDLDSPGSMAWVFPAVQNEADKRYVNYSFPVTPIHARGELLQLLAILQKISRRVNGKHPHLVGLDEANSFLDITVEDPQRRAAANYLGRQADDGFTQYRKLGAGFVVCSQFPTHLSNWRPSLADNIRKNTGTWVVLGMSDKGLEELAKFGATESVINAASDINAGSPYYEHCVVAGGIPWIQRAPEGWYGRALNESGSEPSRVKNLMLDLLPGTDHDRILAFEKAMKDVAARRTSWKRIENALRNGEWS